MRKIEKNLRLKIKDLKREITELKVDREKFRTDFANNFRAALDLLGKGQAWSTKDLVERMAKQSSNYKWWYW